MLLDTRSKLGDKIVETLAFKPNLNVDEIRNSLKSASRKLFTTQGIYQELRKLRDAGVVIKKGSDYNLWGPWVLQVLDFADNLSKTYLKTETFKNIVPLSKQSKSFRFDNLSRLAMFWGQVLSVLIKQTNSEQLLNYSPHQWHYIIRGENGKNIQKALFVSNIKTYTIIGSDTPLDRWAEQYWRKDGNYSFEKCTLHKYRRDHFSVVGNYVVTIKLSKSLSLKMEDMYKKVVTPQFLDFGDLYELFSSGARSTLKIEHNPAKARYIAKKFSEHFGVGLYKS